MKDKSDAEEPKPDLRTQLRKGPIDEAMKSLDDAIEADPENIQSNSMRSILVSRLSSEGKIVDAIAQAELLLQFQLTHCDELEAAIGLASTTLTLRSLYQRNNQAEKVNDIIEQSLAALRPLADADETGIRMLPFARLLSAKAMQMTVSEDYAAAETLLATESDALLARINADAPAEQTVLAWSTLMQARISNATRANSDAQKPLATELDTFISEAVGKNPESTVLMSEFLRLRQMEINRIVRDDPDTAHRLLEQTVAAVEASELKDNPALQRSVSQIKSFTARIAAAKLVMEMIGKPAPALDIEAWAHGEELTVEAMEGKVVLLDFWAIWCGPCIATFPHLKEWHEEFHDQGFEIIGVTRKYGYEWNEETNRATRVQTEVSLEDELSVLDKFMSLHELHHATIVTPDGSDLSSRYGVTGIPHAVLIDRKGNVRMVKVGSGAANASALREMISQLLVE